MKQSDVKSKGVFCLEACVNHDAWLFFAVQCRKCGIAWLKRGLAFRRKRGETLDSVSAGGAPIPGAGIDITES